MAWILVNIVLPISLPLLYMLASKLVDLPPEVRARSQLLTAVQNGQLGWATMGFAASSTYDIVGYISGGIAHELAWLGAGLALSLVLLPLAGFCAALGALFPVALPLTPITSARAWVMHYRLFVTTAACALISATIFAVAHFQRLF